MSSRNPPTQAWGPRNLCRQRRCSAGSTHLVVRALDAATGVRRWEHFSPDEREPEHYSGLLATEGGLVFGASAGYLFALDSTTGHELWRVFLGGSTLAPPISFTVDGRQVIVVSAGRALFMFGLGEGAVAIIGEDYSPHPARSSPVATGQRTASAAPDKQSDHSAGHGVRFCATDSMQIRNHCGSWRRSTSAKSHRPCMGWGHTGGNRNRSSRCFPVLPWRISGVPEKSKSPPPSSDESSVGSGHPCSCKLLSRL